MRLCEFETSSNKKTDGLWLYAWARYKRGDIPTMGEYTYINKRVHDKFPTAELVRMERRFVAKENSMPPTEVWWEFQWIVFNRKEGGAE